ncbi:MAG: hypothetical protein K0U38_09265 [Epsilonproteobacteria bacterium]|nr:hypothetical protein [Campylobacterota bacterium]
MIEKFKISTEMRLWFIGPILMLWIGIYLTGFDVVHWLIYVPAIFALFAFLTGLCPGMFLIRNILQFIEVKK